MAKKDFWFSHNIEIGYNEINHSCNNQDLKINRGQFVKELIKVLSSKVKMREVDYYGIN